MTGREDIAPKPLRVCFPFVGDDVGGSHVSALKLIQNLDTRQIAPVVMLQDSEGPLAAFLRRENQKFTALALPATLTPRRRSHFALLSFAGQTLPHLGRFIREGRFDIVHTNDGRIHVNWGLAARLAGARLVWHHRGDPEARGVNRLAPLIAHHVVSVSYFNKPRRPILSLDGRLSVIHSPFDPPSIPIDRAMAKEALLTELNLPPGTHVMSFVGSLIERKRPLLFVEIIARFRQRHPRIPVVGCIFGVRSPDGPNFEAITRERACALGLQNTIRFMGFRNPIEPCLAASDVLLVPAINEPFGRGLIEAMFVGTPVVATNHGGNPEAIRDNRTGFLVEPENAEAFVEPLARLLSEPALFARISSAAEDQARRSYGTVRHAEQIMAVYRQTIGARSLTPAGAEITTNCP